MPKPMAQAKTKFRMKTPQPNDPIPGYYARVLTPGTIIVVSEKHSTRYFKASTFREFCAAALLLLDERWGSDGYWGTAEENIQTNVSYVAAHTPPDLTVEELIEKTGVSPRSSTVADLKAKWHEYTTRTKEDTQELDLFRRIKRAIKERDGSAAAQIMIDRNNYEYERWQFERIEAPLEKDDG